MSFEKGRYLVKTADSWSELEQALKLRYEVFHREFRNVNFPLGLDVDPFDPVADHLLVLDKSTGAVVGTYRLLSSCYSRFFYSETEFALGRFLAVPGIKLELSRACIHRDFRTGAVIPLLWRGLVKYAEAVNARYLFGLASVKTVLVEDAVTLYRHLREDGAWSGEHQIEPLPAHQIERFWECLRLRDAAGNVGLLSDGTRDVLMPSLLKAYLKAGAKVYGQPAIDRSFACIDFLTVLDMVQMTRSYEKKYSA